MPDSDTVSLLEINFYSIFYSSLLNENIFLNPKRILWKVFLIDFIIPIRTWSHISCDTDKYQNLIYI